MGDLAKGIKSFKKEMAGRRDGASPSPSRSPRSHRAQANPEAQDGGPRKKLRNQSAGSGLQRRLACAAPPRATAPLGVPDSMFDIGWSELLVIGVVAIVVVGPKELPRCMRTLRSLCRQAAPHGDATSSASSTRRCARANSTRCARRCDDASARRRRLRIHCETPRKRLMRRNPNAGQRRACDQPGATPIPARRAAGRNRRGPESQGPTRRSDRWHRPSRRRQARRASA